MPVQTDENIEVEAAAAEVVSSMAADDLTFERETLSDTLEFVHRT